MNRSIVKTRLLDGYIESQLVVLSDEEFQISPVHGIRINESVVNVDDYPCYRDCS